MANNTQIKVLQTAHTGITVSSISTTLPFFTDLLNCTVQRKTQLTPPLSSVTGYQNTVLDIVLLEVPSGGFVELIEYVGSVGHDAKTSETGAAEYERNGEDEGDGRTEKRISGTEMPFVGNWHLCFVVECDLDILLSRVGKYGFEKVGNVARLSAGKWEGWRVVYVRNGEGLTVEFFGK